MAELIVCRSQGGLLHVFHKGSDETLCGVMVQYRLYGIEDLARANDNMVCLECYRRGNVATRDAKAKRK